MKKAINISLVILILFAGIMLFYPPQQLHAETYYTFDFVYTGQATDGYKAEATAGASLDGLVKLRVEAVGADHITWWSEAKAWAELIKEDIPGDDNYMKVIVYYEALGYWDTRLSPPNSWYAKVFVTIKDSSGNTIGTWSKDLPYTYSATETEPTQDYIETDALLTSSSKTYKVIVKFELYVYSYLGNNTLDYKGKVYGSDVERHIKVHRVEVVRYSGGGGCPFVSVYSNGTYILDNNVLRDSEFNSSYCEDLYKLRINPSIINHEIKIRIEELENDYTYLDRVSLILALHSNDVKVNVLDGQLIAYREIGGLLFAFDNNGEPITDLLTKPDNRYYEGTSGDYIITLLDIKETMHPLLLIRADVKTPYSIAVDIYHNEWQELGIIHPRAFWSYEILDLKPVLDTFHIRQQHILLRIRFLDRHKIDYVGIADLVSDFKIITYMITPKSAILYNGDNVTETLMYADYKFVQLHSSEYVIITFKLPSNIKFDEPELVCDFILYLTGFYEVNHNGQQ